MNQPLQPLYFPLLDAPISPSIRNLQVWIEAAWKAGKFFAFVLNLSVDLRAGFDEEGANDLENLVGTNKWIGTAGNLVLIRFLLTETDSLCKTFGLRSLSAAFRESPSNPEIHNVLTFPYLVLNLSISIWRMSLKVSMNINWMSLAYVAVQVSKELQIGLLLTLPQMNIQSDQATFLKPSAVLRPSSTLIECHSSFSTMDIPALL